MEQKAFYTVGNFDHSSIDCDASPASVDEYIKQVIVGRTRIPDVAFVTPEQLAARGIHVSSSSSSQPTTSITTDPLAPSLEWQLSKVADFKKKREALEELRSKVPKLRYNKPTPSQRNKWLALLFEHSIPCVPDEVRACFPTHKGTPPTPAVLLSLSRVEVENLTETICKRVKLTYDEDSDSEEEGDERPISEEKTSLKEEEITDTEKETIDKENAAASEKDKSNNELKASGLTDLLHTDEVDSTIEDSVASESVEESSASVKKEIIKPKKVFFIQPVRHWIFSLLLVLEKNYLHDVVAALRDLARKCRDARKALPENEVDDARRVALAHEYSFFIAVIAHFFEQKDLGDF